MAKETNNRLILFIEQHYIFFTVLTLLLASVNLFAFLGRTPVADWDEARYGVTAYEMIKNGNYVLTTYLNNPNYWTLKPPLGVWMIAAAYRVFGYSEFSLRFFSALLALFSVTLTMTLAKRHFGKGVSIFSGLSLATTFGFIMRHSGRTGDLDSALTFFTVLSVVFIDRSGQNILFFYAAGLAGAFAFLLKSFASLPIFLIILIYLLGERRFLRIRFREYLVFFFVSLSPIILWAVARYFEDGFIFFKAMASYDLLRRSAESLEGHSGGPLYYLKELVFSLAPWSFLCSLLLVFVILDYKFTRIAFSNSGDYKDNPSSGYAVTGFCSPPIFWIWLVVPLVLFSVAKTKLSWYINTVYPAVAVLLARFLVDTLKIGEIYGRKWKVPLQTFLILAFLCVFAIAETRIFTYIIEQTTTANEAQALLRGLRTESVSPGARIFMTGKPTQSEVFTAKVLHGLNIHSLSRDEFESLKRTYANNLLMVDTKAREHIVSNLDQIARQAKVGDLALIENTKSNLNFLFANNFVLLDRNAGWTIGKKVGPAERAGAPQNPGQISSTH